MYIFLGYNLSAKFLGTYLKFKKDICFNIGVSNYFL